MLYWQPGTPMRVIAGTAKGRRLRTPRGWAVRPTADRVKEALFSMLLSRFDLDGAVLLDLYAGSGALGIEGLSRGAAAAVFVEQDRVARQALEGNLSACGMTPQGRVLGMAVDRAIRQLAVGGERFDGVLLDPPYGQGLADASLEQLAAGALVAPGGWVAAEHHVDDALAESYGRLRLTTARRYGKTALALFSDSRMVEQVAAS
jgi:16S rRNA (guanine(966)-N(2))-methyltransferase RsmD